MVKPLVLYINCLLIISVAYSQVKKNPLKFKQYDSLQITTIIDQSFNQLTNEAPVLINTGTATLNKQDATELDNRIRTSSSYGASQAMTPVYDLEINYYKNGKSKEKILISLWTNNLYASYPLKVQRIGFCACTANSGFCCSNGGINYQFKEYLIQLLEKNNISVPEKQEILDFGNDEYPKK